MASQKQAAYLFDLAIAYADYATELGFQHGEYNSAQDIEHKLGGRQASEFISKILTYSSAAWEWRPLSRQAVAAELAYQYCREQRFPAFGRRHYDSVVNIARRIGFQGEFKALVFTRNEDGQRIPLSNSEAEEAFRKLLSAVKERVNDRLQNRDEDTKDEHKIPDSDPEENQDDDEPDMIPDPEPEPEPEIGTQADEFWRRYQLLRELAESHDVGGHQIDTLERRPYIAAAKMIAEGIPNQAIFWAMCMHWPENIRREQAIVPFDVQTFKPDNRVDGMPAEFPYLDALYRQRINPWLISAAGVGKTTFVQKFAEHYGQPHCAIPLNRGTSPSAFNGRPKLSNTSIMIRYLKAMGDQDEEAMVRIAREAEREGDVTVSEFTKIFRDGGHILLDELDAGDENLLMMVNMPLANGRFANTASGETYQIHPDTMIWAASNTMGLGVTAGQGREYRGRNALDFATIDRFRMGRVVLKGDINEYRKHFEAMILAYK